MFEALGQLVAPDVSPLQDLTDHWTRFLEYYSSRTVTALKAEPIEKTRLTFHLNKILSILIKEQEDSSAELLSPCLEYFLQKDVLNILVTLCQADTPPGIRPYIFKVFIFLLEQVKYPLIYETACHLPLCRLTLVCSLTKASPTETQEIEFLSLICDKIKKSPHLIQVFLPEAKSSVASNLSSRSSRSSSMINLQQIETLALNVKQALDSVKSTHYLGTALLNYLDSPDYCLSCRAMQNLINLSGVDSEESAKALISDSPLVQLVEDRISTLYKKIPDDIDPGRIEELEVNWIQAHKLHSPEFAEENFPGRSELISFLSFLDYVDTLVGSAHHFISSSLAGRVSRLIVDIIQELIIDQAEDQRLRGLSYLSVTWNHTKSTQLRDHISCQMFDEEEVDDCTCRPSLFSQILSLWDECGMVQVESMRIFDTLLSPPHQVFIDNLLANNLESRGYFNQTLAEGEVSSWSDVEDEREKSRSRSRSRSRSANRELIKDGKTGGENLRSKTIAPSNIHRVVNMWLYLVEDELRLDELRGSGYDLYVKDAGRQLEDVARKCSRFTWETEAVFSADTAETCSTDSRCESDPTRGFYPGLFLEKLFGALGSMLKFDYDSNLQITSIFSRLVQLPHPYIHEYLLNPTLPVQDGVPTLFSTLRKLMIDATKRCSTVKHYPKKMLYSRKKLLGDPSMVTENVFEDPEEENLFNCIVIVDEFCKELAAISLVKYHMYS